MLGLLVLEVLLEQVDLVVLLDAALDGRAQFLDRLREGRLLLDLLLELVGVLHLRRVDVGGPAALLVEHALVGGLDALGVHAVHGLLDDVVEHDEIRVPLAVFEFHVRDRIVAAVLDLGVAESERLAVVLPLLLVGVEFRHGSLLGIIFEKKTRK